MKKLLATSAELLSFSGLALLIGFFLEKKFSLNGLGVISCLLLAYFLWFLNFYRRNSR